MKKLTMALSFTLVSLFSASAFAEYVCKWTAQGTDDNFSKDPIYSQKPKMEKEGCSGPQSAPACTGFIYCKDDARDSQAPPQIVPVACKTVKIADKWRCPDAKTCYDDEDVIMQAVAKIPSKVAPAGDGSGGAVREGVGGR